MSKQKQTAIVRAKRGQLDATPQEPEAPWFTKFLTMCTERSRYTMVACLHAAARILAPAEEGSEGYARAAQLFPWPSLKHDHVVYVMAALDGKNASPARSNLIRSALRKMARVLFSLRLIDVDERQRIDDVPTAKGEREPRGRALDQRELRKLFRACERDETAAGRRDAALIAVMFGGGLRRDEASKLDVVDFDARAGTLAVIGKGNKKKTQPIGPEVVQALQAWIEVRGKHAGPLFVVIDKFGRIGERRLLIRPISKTIDKRAEQASIEPQAGGHRVSPHDLRRTAITDLLEAGENLSTAAKFARHASVTTTARYDRSAEKVVRAAVAKLRVPFSH